MRERENNEGLGRSMLNNRRLWLKKSKYKTDNFQLQYLLVHVITKPITVDTVINLKSLITTEGAVKHFKRKPINSLSNMDPIQETSQLNIKQELLRN